MNNRFRTYTLALALSVAGAAQAELVLQGGQDAQTIAAVLIAHECGGGPAGQQQCPQILADLLLQPKAVQEEHLAAAVAQFRQLYMTQAGFLTVVSGQLPPPPTTTTESTSTTTTSTSSSSSSTQPPGP